MALRKLIRRSSAKNPKDALIEGQVWPVALRTAFPGAAGIVITSEPLCVNAVYWWRVQADAFESKEALVAANREPFIS